MWCLGTWFRGRLGRARSTVGHDDLGVLFHPKWFYVSVLCNLTSLASSSASETTRHTNQKGTTAVRTPDPFLSLRTHPGQSDFTSWLMCECKKYVISEVKLGINKHDQMYKESQYGRCEKKRWNIFLPKKRKIMKEFNAEDQVQRELRETPDWLISYQSQSGHKAHFHILVWNIFHSKLVREG